MLYKSLTGWDLQWIQTHGEWVCFLKALFVASCDALHNLFLTFTQWWKLTNTNYFFTILLLTFFISFTPIHLQRTHRYTLKSSYESITGIYIFLSWQTSVVFRVLCIDRWAAHLTDELRHIKHIFHVNSQKHIVSYGKSSSMNAWSSSASANAASGGLPETNIRTNSFRKIFT